jgi:hypothetical protein
LVGIKVRFDASNTSARGLMNDGKQHRAFTVSPQEIAFCSRRIPLESQPLSLSSRCFYRPIKMSLNRRIIIILPAEKKMFMVHQLEMVFHQVASNTPEMLLNRPCALFI